MNTSPAPEFGRARVDAELNVLALNSGSSSLKFGLYRVGVAGLDLLLTGSAESIGDGEGRFSARTPRQKELTDQALSIPSAREAIVRVSRLLAECNLPAPAAIGHRIVHGGPNLPQHCLIDDSILRQLAGATAFAPLHLPAALSVIRFAQEHFPGLPQAACFDTSFHAALPPLACTLPLPKALQQGGIRRYGFHGLSCESIVRHLAGDLPERVVIAHLGNGASVTAVRHGQSIDTSMGLTPTGGVIMSTRSGDLDPGLLIHLMRTQELDATRLEELVDQRSGLLGISGISSDLRRLREAESTNRDAQLAIEMFCYSVAKSIAGMIAALDGIDLLVFTGGIGENDAQARATICRHLRWIGVVLDDSRNQHADNPIHAAASRCAVQVLPAQEDEQIVRHTWALLSKTR